MKSLVDPLFLGKIFDLLTIHLVVCIIFSVTIIFYLLYVFLFFYFFISLSSITIPNYVEAADHPK